MATIKKVWDAGILSVSLRDGESVLDSFTFDPNAVSAEVRGQAEQFGFGTKIGNFGALPQGTPERDRFEAMRKGATQLVETGWKAARSEGEDGGADSELELLAKAAAQVTGMSADEALAYVKAAKPAERTALRKDREVATALAALRPESAAKPSLLEQMRAKAQGGYATPAEGEPQPEAAQPKRNRKSQNAEG